MNSVHCEFLTISCWLTCRQLKLKVKLHYGNAISRQHMDKPLSLSLSLSVQKGTQICCIRIVHSQQVKYRQARFSLANEQADNIQQTEEQINWRTDRLAKQKRQSGFGDKCAESLAKQWPSAMLIWSSSKN